MGLFIRGRAIFGTFNGVDETFQTVVVEPGLLPCGVGEATSSSQQLAVLHLVVGRESCSDSLSCIEQLKR